MRYAPVLVLALCVAGGVAVGDDLEDCRRAVEAKDWQAAVEPCTKAAEQGHASAQFNLGSVYHTGWVWLRDNAKAVELYTKAAEQGHAEAQFSLGWIYEYGFGAPQDYAKAVEWLTKAAEQGHARAQFNLGWMYYNGEGVPKNLKIAYFWLNISAMHQEDPESRKRIAGVRDSAAEEMTPQDIAEAERMSAEWLEKLWAWQKED